MRNEGEKISMASLIADSSQITFITASMILFISNNTDLKEWYFCVALHRGFSIFVLRELFWLKKPAWKGLQAVYSLQPSLSKGPMEHIEVLIKLFFERRILSYCQIRLKTIAFNQMFGKRFLEG